jgi:hypothetical protein
MTDALAQWHEFYSAVANAGAALVGLVYSPEFTMTTCQCRIRMRQRNTKPSRKSAVRAAGRPAMEATPCSRPEVA